MHIVKRMNIISGEHPKHDFQGTLGAIFILCKDIGVGGWSGKAPLHNIKMAPKVGNKIQSKLARLKKKHSKGFC